MSRTCGRWLTLYLLQVCRFSSLVLAICSGVGSGGFGRGGCYFFLSARRCCLSFKMDSLFCMYHSCFRCFAKSGSLLGILNKTGSCLGSLSICIVLSANHRSRSRRGRPILLITRVITDRIGLHSVLLPLLLLIIDTYIARYPLIVQSAVQ